MSSPHDGASALERIIDDPWQRLVCDLRGELAQETWSLSIGPGTSERGTIGLSRLDPPGTEHVCSSQCMLSSWIKH